MAFTRFNYDKARVQKNFTTSNRSWKIYVKCLGNAGDKPEIFNDPQVRLRNGVVILWVFTTDIQLILKVI